MSVSRESALRIKRAALQLVCALLLFAQYAGLTHAIWHAANHVPQYGQTLSGSGEPARTPASPDASRFCDLDAMLGQVLGAGPIAAPAFHTHAPDAQTPWSAHGDFATRDTLTPRSRGPPSLV
jgi:hypothetical protein